MRIGIITFHASFNYGSMLQAYALHKVLTDMGHDVEIINFRSAEQREMYRFPVRFTSPEWSKLHMLMHYVKHFRLYFHKIRKWNRYNSFLNKYLTHTKEFHTFEELKQYEFDYDYLVIGSDQIWNTRCYDFNEAYLGNFCKKNIKKISYAASMGANPELLCMDNFILNLKDYYAVSVREERTKCCLFKSNAYPKISLALDPTLLLEKFDYDNLCLKLKDPLYKGEYVFFYDPFYRPQYLEIAINLVAKLGYTLVIDRTYPKKCYGHYSNLVFYTNVGPIEFINLVKHAKLILAHSLHGVLFSIIYKKDFFALNGDADSRMSYILKVLGLESRAINIDNPNIHTNLQIDIWDSVYEKYSLLKKDSYSFLKNYLV